MEEKIDEESQKSDRDLMNQIENFSDFGKLTSAMKDVTADGQDIYQRKTPIDSHTKSIHHSIVFSNKNDGDLDNTQLINSHTNQNSERVLKTSGGTRGLKTNKLIGQIKVGKNSSLHESESEIVSYKAVEKKKKTMERGYRSKYDETNMGDSMEIIHKEGENRQLNIKMNFKQKRDEKTETHRMTD